MVAILNDKMRDSDVSSVHRLAQEVGDKVSRSQLYDVMAGKRTIDLVELEAICDALGLQAGAVLYDAQRAVAAAEKPAGETKATG